VPRPKEKKERRRGGPRASPPPPLSSVPSVVAFVPPAKPVRVHLVSWLSHRSLASHAVREGFAMFDVDRHGKTFVAARIVASWRRWEGEEKGRKE
jgi:hypothetical protein